MDSFVFTSSAFDPFASWRGPSGISCDEPVPVAFPNGMLPPLIDLRTKRDASLWSRSARSRACDRVDALPVWAGMKQILRLLVKRGKGDRHRCILSHEHIAELLHRSGCIRGERGTLYTVQHVRRCLRRLEDLGFVRWRRMMPGDRFPSRDFRTDDAGDEVKVGCCVYEVNMPALLGDGPVWPARQRRPGAGGRPRKLAPVDAVLEAEEAAAAAAEFRELEPLVGFDQVEPEPETPAPVVAPPAAPVHELSAEAVRVSMDDLDQVIIHDQCSGPASQDLKIAPERHGAREPQRPAAAHEAVAPLPRESFRAAGAAPLAPTHTTAPPRGLTAAKVESETPPSAEGPSAPHDGRGGADAPRAPTDQEHGARQREREPATQAPAGFITDPDGVQHSFADVVREMPDWFRALGDRHRRSRAARPPAAPARLPANVIPGAVEAARGLVVKPAPGGDREPWSTPASRQAEHRAEVLERREAAIDAAAKLAAT